MSEDDLMHSCSPKHEFICSECPLQDFSRHEAAEGVVQVIRKEILGQEIGTAKTELGLAINGCRRARQRFECVGESIDDLKKHADVTIVNDRPKWVGTDLIREIIATAAPAGYEEDSLLRERINHSEGQLKCAPKQQQG